MKTQTEEPYEDDPSVTADLAHGDNKIKATPAVEAVKPLAGSLDDEPSAAALKVVHTLWPVSRGRLYPIQTDWGSKTPKGLAACIDSIVGLPELLAQRADLLAAAQTLIDGCEAHLEAQGYALQISGMIATRAAIDRAEKGAS